MLLKLQQIVVKPGQQMLLQDISWQQLENILEEMGERRAARISYSDGWLEIMVPLTEHEKDKESERLDAIAIFKPHNRQVRSLLKKGLC